MKTVDNGATVQLHFVGRLENGEVFDSTEDEKPVDLRIGSGLLIKRFEEQLLGLKEGDKKTFVVKAEDAYGSANDNLKKEFRRDELPAEYEPAVLDILGAEFENGVNRPVRITSVEGDRIFVDLNHPLAGKDLIFDIEIVKIISPGRDPLPSDPAVKT